MDNAMFRHLCYKFTVFLIEFVIHVCTWHGQFYLPALSIEWEPCIPVKPIRVSKQGMLIHLHTEIHNTKEGFIFVIILKIREELTRILDSIKSVMHYFPLFCLVCYMVFELLSTIILSYKLYNNYLTIKNRKRNHFYKTK